MFRIALLLFSLVATTLAGSAVVVALTLGYDALVPILWSAGMGVDLPPGSSLAVT